MINVLIDTNILFDAMVSARPQHASAKQLVKLVAENRLEASVCAGSLKDFYYVSSKYIEEAQARSFIRLFMELFAVLPLDRAICKSAIASDEPDFEDGLIRALAEAEQVDCIVTRDETAFTRSCVKRIDAEALLHLIQV